MARQGHLDFAVRGILRNCSQEYEGIAPIVRERTKHALRQILLGQFTLPEVLAGLYLRGVNDVADALEHAGIDISQ